MDADNIELQGLLESPFQYVIPPFQRFYEWDKEDWEQLWDDIFDLYRREGEDEGRQHFAGSLVFYPVPHRLGSDPILLVIDGQQRLLTVSLMLCALRNIARSLSHGRLAEEIDKKYVINEFEEGRDRFRLYPRQRDRTEYKAAVTAERAPKGKLGKALRFFTRKIREDVLAEVKRTSGVRRRMSDAAGEQPQASGDAEETETLAEDRLRQFLAVLKRALTFVHITLDAKENAFQVYQSINATGVDLSQADLIRSQVMMHAPARRLEEFDEKEWGPIEDHFTDEHGRVDAKSLSRFFRHVLLTSGSYVYKDDTEQTFTKRYIADDKTFDPKELAATLRRFARLYDYLRGICEHPSEAVAEAIQMLIDLETTTAFPLALRLLDMLDQGEVSDQVVAEALRRVAGFVFRRKVCAMASTGYVRWFAFACKDKYLEHEEGTLAGLTAFLREKGYPTDEQFNEAFKQFELFRSDYKRAALEALEQSYDHRERADLSQAQVEHVMPQTLTDAWRSALGPDAERLHERLLHVPGNLTLSAYNGELANDSFAEKRPEYERSNIALTRHLANLKRWGREEIEARSHALAQQATEIWTGPPFEEERPTS